MLLNIPTNRAKMVRGWTQSSMKIHIIVSIVKGARDIGRTVEKEIFDSEAYEIRTSMC